MHRSDDLSERGGGSALALAFSPGYRELEFLASPGLRDAAVETRERSVAAEED